MIVSGVNVVVDGEGIGKVIISGIDDDHSLELYPRVARAISRGGVTTSTTMQHREHIDKTLARTLVEEQQPYQLNITTNYLH